MAGFNMTAMLDNFQKYLPEKLDDRFLGVGNDVRLLLTECVEALYCSASTFSKIILDLQSVIDFTWEKLNTGHWKDVPSVERRVYAFASLLKAIAILKKASKLESSTEVKIHLKDALKTADMGLLLGSDFRSQLTHIASVLSCALDIGKSNSNLTHNSFATENASKNREETHQNKIPCKNLFTLECPSLEYFHRHHFKKSLPVKITGCMSHWPALKKWSDLSYFRQLAGSRTVPIELGSNYLESDWSQSLMTLNTFMDQYINANHDVHDSESLKSSVAYLAQHQLFDQVPELREDIFEPEYCCLTEDPEREPEGTDINAWFGPEGTVSPLHYDPKHNLLSQVVGRKRIILFSPEDDAKLYPHEGNLVSNSAQVDPENPDFEQFPQFQRAEGYECILNPGEMLYIPPKWWHHVRAFSVSFSVSFWWE